VPTSSCAKCGSCSAVCPVFRSSGRESHTARGKLHLLDVLGLAKASTDFIDIFSACLLCGACSQVCPRSIDITKEIVTARSSFSAVSGPHGYEKYLIRKLLGYPVSLAGLRVLGSGGQKLLAAHLPEDSGLRLRLGLFGDGVIPGHLGRPDSMAAVPDENSASVVWFPGCSGRYLIPDIITSCRSVFAVSGSGLTIPESLACCGLADCAAGDIYGAQKKARKNILVLEKTSGSILVSCASCYAHLKKYPELFGEDAKWKQRAVKLTSRLLEFSHALQELKGKEAVSSKASIPKIRVFYHEPCHLRYDPEFVDKTREYLQNTGKVELVSLESGVRCCGQGGLFHVAHPEISATIRDRLVDDVLRLQPTVVTTTCSGCLMQWQQGVAKVTGSQVRVLHVAQLLDELEAI